MKPIRIALSVLLSLLSASVIAAPPPNVIIVTLDGVRVEEMFTGLDESIARSVTPDAEHAARLYAPWRGSTPQQSRERIMPFFWGRLMREHGWIAGNAALGSQVLLRNPQRFSYPGYAEMLTGLARTHTVTSNAKIQNPHPTVLEFVREQLQLPKAKVAAFGSWDRFEVIPEHTPGNITVNAGFVPFIDNDPGIQRLNSIQAQARTWREERFDAFTIAFALRYLERERPRLMFIGLGDTDEWAHSGRYIDTLEAMALADECLRDLWNWVQSQPDYRGNTLLIVTTDHGRGRTPEDWMHHGPEIEGAQDVWVAMIGAGQTLRGELQHAPTLYLAQVASSIAAGFGLDLRQLEPDAQMPIQDVLQGR